MPGDVRAKRPYNSSLRREQARATRRSILQAAQRLFERDGYVPTTMESIASEAGVASKTVYLAFATKGALLRGVWDLALKGDIDDAPVAQRNWYVEVLEEPDPERQLRLNARNSRRVRERIGPMLRVIRSAAAVDADGAGLWALIQSDFHANQRVVVESLHRRGALRARLGVDMAADLLWTLNHPDVWLLLVGERGWSADAFEQWLGDATCRELLGAPSGAATPAAPLAPKRGSRSSRASGA